MPAITHGSSSADHWTPQTPNGLTLDASNAVQSTTNHTGLLTTGGTESILDNADIVAVSGGMLQEHWQPLPQLGEPHVTRPTMGRGGRCSRGRLILFRNLPQGQPFMPCTSGWIQTIVAFVNLSHLGAL